MIFISNQFGRRTGFLGGGPGCLIFGILAVVAIWFIFKGLYALLYWAAPGLFVLALIIKWKAVAETGRDFVTFFQRNPLGALLLGAVCVVAFPLLALYLFLKALGYDRVQEIKRQFGTQDPLGRQQPPEDEFVEFEELESQPKGSKVVQDEPVELPIVPEKETKPEPKKPQNPYDQMFEES